MLFEIIQSRWNIVVWFSRIDFFEKTRVSSLDKLSSCVNVLASITVAAYSLDEELLARLCLVVRVQMNLSLELLSSVSKRTLCFVFFKIQESYSLIVVSFFLFMFVCKIEKMLAYFITECALSSGSPVLAHLCLQFPRVIVNESLFFFLRTELLSLWLYTPSLLIKNRTIRLF